MKIVGIDVSKFLKSEHEPNTDFLELFNKHNLMMGRMISGSKSGYTSRHPDNKVVFNGNIITQNDGKIWYGDLDLDIDRINLQKIANKLNKTLYILREHDARFENEKAGMKYWTKMAVEIIEPKI